MRLIGHRGARAEAPENTLAGFRHLRSLGVRAVEFDIRVSADDQLVVIHDSALDRTTNGIGDVASQPAAALAQLDACHRAFPHWQGSEGIPTLTQVLQELDDFHHIELEVKVTDPNAEAKVLAQLPALWQTFHLAGRARVTSFNPRMLFAIQQAHPDIPRGFLFEADFMGDAMQIAQALGCDAIGPHEQRCDEALIAAAHERGWWVSTWTVNSPERALNLQRIGLDGLITDCPSQAQKWLTWTD